MATKSVLQLETPSQTQWPQSGGCVTRNGYCSAARRTPTSPGVFYDGSI